MTELRVTSPVLSNDEAARYLRLVSDDGPPEQIQNGVRRLHGLVRAGKLRPLAESRPYTFWIEELNRYVREDTEAFVPRGSER